METKKFDPIVNQGQSNYNCPPMPPPCPHPLPPPTPCPYPHGKIFQGCLAYINSDIDIRAKQLFAKLKQYIYSIVGKYNGPWDEIKIRDVNHPENVYSVFIEDGNLRSKLIEGSEEEENTESSDTSELIGG